ncbi:Z band alternatively spliced PDZ-motif protein 52 isoform X3 [Choristoneura fumiferana]|uniref:Z band alternatively spliced PDZ-motif protein 52 isoform X3 n=1 Tax=Choristoneura fumiferana TaxID=7141 RepID=UPI003D15CFAF
MAQLLTVRLNKAGPEPLGFRLQGGKDFGTPLVVQKVNGGSAAERAGLQAGDALIKVNSTDVFTLRHQEAQDAIRAAGVALELTVQRGGGTWRPTVTPTGSLPRPGSRPLGSSPTPVTNTSLKANHQPSLAFGSGHNNVAKPFGYMNGNENVKSIVNKQYNTPVKMYSDQTIAETLSAQTEVLAGGVLGVNFKKNEKHYDAEKSAVFKVLQEEQNDPEPVEVGPGAPPAATGLRHVQAPVTRPDAPLNNTGGLPVGQNICEECERLITGVFVRIKDKNLHVECFKCSTCGTSLKNQGYYNLNGKLYCDIHAKLVARQNPPAPNLEPVTVPPGGRVPTNTYSTPLPPLTTNNYSNGSSSMFSPSSNLSGPKPFGSSIGSAYSPSLSPRSAPMSPARPVTAPAPAQTPFTPAPAYTPAPASAPAYAPAPAPAPAHAPFAPTNEMPTHHIPHKPEFKSAAEERLIRKMAKMALNGYEIGVQRKIKPADHIQSMADKIQDTVVTKHPLNTDSLSSGDSSRENTLRRPINNTFERTYKPDNNIQCIGDKIKDTLLINHPTNFTSGNAPVPPPMNFGDKLKDHSNQSMPVVHNSNGVPPPPPPMGTLEKLNDSSIKNYSTPIKNNNAPVPPPIPNTPIPTFNIRTSPTGQLLDMLDSKSPLYCESVGTNLSDKSQISDNTNKRLNGTNGFNNVQKEKVENNFLSTLRKKDANEKSSFLNGSNKQDTYKSEQYVDSKNKYILGKRKSFEKDILSNETNGCTGHVATQKEKIDNIVPDTNTLKKANLFEKISNEKSTNQFHDDQTPKIDVNLYDNSLYTLKPVKANGTNNVTPRNWNISDDVETVEEKTALSNNEEKQNDNDSDVVVKRRQKRNDRNADGRRDSHIIARPQSTMTSADVADGLLPVCHICDKTITRGPFITALGRIWCPEHFICVNATCRRPLQDIGFVEENGQLYCEFCFEQYIAPACDKCHAKIKGDCLNAIGKHFHPECFNCVYCGKLFGNNPFFLEDGLPYCESDWNELFTTKCFACGFPVEAGDRWVEALNNNYHSHCFNCTVCKKNLEGQSFFAKGGRPFCKSHAR